MYSFFIGCDVSKGQIDVSFHNGQEKAYLGEFDNDHQGFEDAVSLLCTKTDVCCSLWFFCFENTGVYSKVLLEWLFSQGIPCREENALKISRSLGLRRGKNDKIDSLAICNYAFEKRDSIQPSVLTKPLIVKLRKLLSRRDLLVKHKKALIVSLKEQKNILDPGFFCELEKGNKELIAAYSEQIRHIELMIKELISTDPHTEKNHELAQSVIGIGPIISATVLAATQNYTSFSAARKFACYSGIAPFPNQSGIKKGKPHVSQMANKNLKSLLSNGANAAVQHDPQLKAFYNRKLAEGKEYGVVINAVKNKLIHRIFCVINRQSPYVKIRAYA